jgi:signal transduction histidine kinase
MRDMQYHGRRVELRYEVPFGEILYDFHDRLKSLSRGYASMDYKPLEYRAGALSRSTSSSTRSRRRALVIAHRDKAYEVGRKIVDKMAEVIPRQMFAVPVQAAIGGKILARATVRAFRKDVLAKCYGGDITRKKKLLEKQKKGKARMKQLGNVEVPQEAFLAVLSSDDTGERSTYVSTLIHDMKTPLLAVERSLAVVEGEADADARRRWVGAARSEVRRLLDLVQDVVDAERLASGTLELQVGEVDLADVCRRVVERLAPVRDDVDIELAPLGSWRHAGDGALLERAIENIVANAVRHARSKVHVDLTPGLVRVADDGPGLPSDFDALGIVKSTLGGTPMTSGVSPRNPGLGLFIAKRILEAHGGRLTLESSGPQGTTMLLYVGVPRREAATAS